ncbi:MAG: glycosyltransferase family 4 protein [Spirochaetes bacterium]|nr:glycosyltransferase family 4 protein [Spirochaetota bacterium]
MHVAFIVTRADSIGGAQIHVRDMALRLLPDGHRVSVLTGSEGPLTDILQDAGVDVRILPHLVRPMNPLKDVLAILEARSHLRDLQPDLVSTHTAKAGLVGRVAAWSLGIPSIFTAHGWQFAEGISMFQRIIVESLERFTARISEKIITVSDYDRELALSRKVVPPEKLITIHNGMPDVPNELVRWLSHPDENLGTPTELGSPVRLIMVARLQPQKDHPTLFRALSELKDRNWTLELVGDGPDRESLQILAGEMGIADRVIFAGQRLDVPERLRKADIFVLATRWEGFPRSILEAMRAGLPVVATDVGGCRESVVDGETGFLVSKEDPLELRDRLRMLIESSELRIRMGQKGRKRFEENFTFQRMYERTLEVYREVTGRSG